MIVKDNIAILDATDLDNLILENPDGEKTKIFLIEEISSNDHFNFIFDVPRYQKSLAETWRQDFLAEWF